MPRAIGQAKYLSPVFPPFSVKYKSGFPYSILTFYQRASGLACPGGGVLPKSLLEECGAFIETILDRSKQFSRPYLRSQQLVYDT